jgi:hypothetical protein
MKVEQTTVASRPRRLCAQSLKDKKSVRLLIHGTECDGQLKADESAVLRMDGLW